MSGAPWRSHSRPGGQPAGLDLLRPRVHLLARQGSILPTASPLGEEEPGPEDAKRGGYLPIPGRDARAGEWVTGDASAEPDPATATRATARERVTERHRYRKQRRAVCETICEERGECSLRRGGDDEAGGIRETGTGKDIQGLGASGAEWRSTGQSGGADGDEAERAVCPVTRNQSTPGAAPTRRGAEPLL